MNQVWNNRFMGMAELIAQWSKDPSTKVGCVVVNDSRQILTTGYNGFPRGVRDDARLDDREQKYPIICHAEENAIVQAAFTGISIRGAAMYATLHPCARCARLIVQAGIEDVYTREEVPERWAEDARLARLLIGEAGGRVHFVERSTF
jgi:dCMP deaminase